MTHASMTFGRPERLVIPRGSAWLAAGASLLIDGLRRLDRWQLSQQRDEPRTAARMQIPKDEVAPVIHSI